MAECQEISKVLPASSKFEANPLRQLDYLNLEPNRNSSIGKVDFWMYRKSGVYLQNSDEIRSPMVDLAKINPSNFPSIAYLDLEACYYEEKMYMKEIASQIWPSNKTTVQHNMEHRSFMYCFFYKTKKDRCDYTGLMFQEVDFELFPFCPVLECLLSGFNRRMLELLKYGVQKIHTSKLMPFLHRGESYPLYSYYSVLDVLEENGVEMQLPDPDWETYFLHRAFLLIEIMYMICNIVRFSLGHSCCWRNCCELLWRSIPDPYLSQEEIKDFLPLLLVERSYTTVNTICDVYRETFPAITLFTTTPRSLKHTCRCVIRHCLRQSFSLPEGIDQLMLDINLKSFLRLET